MMESSIDLLCQPLDGNIQTFKANDFQGVAVLRKCLAVYCLKASVVDGNYSLKSIICV